MAQENSGLTITRLGLAPDIDEKGLEHNELRLSNSTLTNVIFTNVITPTFTEQMVYGRNEPLVVYRNTIRTINFSFTLGSPGSSMAAINKVQRMVYPLYDESGIVIGTPIFKIRYNNLIYDPNTEDGLIGIIKDLNVGEQFSYGRVLMGDAAKGTEVGIGINAATSTNALTTVGSNENSIITYISMKVAFNFIPLPNKPIGHNVKTFSIANREYPFKLNK
jgi:hypothetical protein